MIAYFINFTSINQLFRIKFVVGAVKDQETDVDALHAAYLAKLAEREAKAEAKAAEKAAKA